MWGLSFTRGIPICKEFADQFYEACKEDADIQVAGECVKVKKQFQSPKEFVEHLGDTYYVDNTNPTSVQCFNGAHGLNYNLVLVLFVSLILILTNHGNG